MADYPTLVQTWQYNVNQLLVATGSQAADAQRLMLALVNSFIGSPGFLNSWTVVQSSNNGVANAANNWVPVALVPTATLAINSTTVTFSSAVTLPAGTALVFSGEPGVTYYLSAALAGTVGTLTAGYTGTPGGGQTVTATSLTWAGSGTTHSWIVLKQAGVSANFQVLIDLNSANTFYASVTMSPNAGFGSGSAGTITNAPTATDGVPLFAGPAGWGVDSASSVQYRLHFMQSQNGACSRAFVCRYANGIQGGIVSAYIAFELPQNPVTGWAFPVMGDWLGSSSANQQLVLSYTYQNAYAVGRGV
jgi:hypothetical protein